MRALMVALIALPIACFGADEAAPASAFAAVGKDVFESQVVLSMTRAARLYPDAGSSGTLLYDTLQKELNRLAAVNSPVLKDPAWPEFVCAKVAAELGIAPRKMAAK